jgi:tetratricopeptide (TPR) repeat protein
MPFFVRISRWATCAVFLGALLLNGCNLFNPQGDGSLSEDPQASGEILYRQGRFAAAMAAFDQAIRADSTNSMAYYWYAKATARHYKLDNLGVLNDLEETQTTGRFAFVEGRSDSLMNLRLAAAVKVRRVLGTLINRDTLTRWYGYVRDSSSSAARGDTLRDARIAWMQQYLGLADAGTPGYRARDRFPLTDFRMPYERLIVDFTALDMMYVLTSKLRDLDKNDTIDARDDLLKDLSFGKDGGFAIDSLGKIADDLETDPEAVENLNNLIQGMQSGLEGISALAQLMAQASANDTGGGAGGQASKNIDSVISSLGENVVFFQFGDEVDNDGDGCVDEEVLDDRDNDDDGFVDEDARITVNTLFERADNDRNGLVNDSGLVNGTVRAPLEDRIGIAQATPAQPHSYILAFVHNFYTQFPDSAGKFVKIRKGSDRMSLRTRIQKDSLGLASRKLLPTYAQKLDSAKTLIGGCWRNFPAPSAKRGFR